MVDVGVEDFAVAEAVKSWRQRLPVGLYSAMCTGSYALKVGSPALIDQSNRQCRFLFGDDVDIATMNRFAPTYLKIQAERSERRWLIDRLPYQRLMAGKDHLVEAQAAGRGVVVSFFHHGFYEDIPRMLSSEGARCVAVVSQSMLLSSAPKWLRQHAHVLGQHADLLNADSGGGSIQGQLQAGRVLVVAADVRGSTPIEAFGRTVSAATGALRRAQEADALVLPLVTKEVNGVPGFVFLEPLEARAASSPAELLSRLVETMEPSALEAPHRYDMPTFRWTGE
jgi:lauroyl/myristoyl acyltransferase